LLDRYDEREQAGTAQLVEVGSVELPAGETLSSLAPPRLGDLSY
jgi:hypothetical protein